jgi:lipopolysaccharide transport system ATP-binding protein
VSQTVIRVEQLGKKYLLAHQAGGYTTLREQLTEQTKAFYRHLRQPRGKRESSARRQEFWALEDVCFEVKAGDRLGIIGRNGAGKSTLLKILSRITDPTRGRVAIKGRVASLLEVGTGFHPELTGRENIYLNGAILGMSKVEIKHKFDEIVAFAEVEKFLDTPVKRYSSGMYVRLAFAVAAHLEPEVLVVDEVLAVGDLQFQQKCLGKMEQVGKEGRTVLFVSHNLGTIQTLCNRAVLLSQGKVLVDDKPSVAVSHYLRNLEAASNQSLSDRQDRYGKGPERLEHIEISTGGSYPSPTLATGYPARFAFYVTSICPGLSCCFTVYDQHGQPVTYFDSAIHSYEDVVDAKQKLFQFICEVEELPLIPGRYRINAALMRTGEIVDDVKAAAFFEVEQGKIRGRPVARTTGYGSVLIQHRWVAPI